MQSCRLLWRLWTPSPRTLLQVRLAVEFTIRQDAQNPSVGADVAEVDPADCTIRQDAAKAQAFVSSTSTPTEGFCAACFRCAW